MARVGATAALVMLATLATLAAASCTTFYGLEPTASEEGAGGGGGQGGSADAPARSQAFLPLLDAAYLCSRIFACPSLGPSIVRATGLPLVETGAAGAKNYSACVDWLTLPLAPARTRMRNGTPDTSGFDVPRSMLVCMTATSTCESALRCAFTEALAPGDPRCADRTGTYCDDQGDAIDCDRGLSQRCGSLLFPPGSACQSGPGGVRCAVGGCGAPEASCDLNLPYSFVCDATQLRSGLNCAALGLYCSDDAAAPEDRGCLGALGLPSCAELGQQRCSADGKRASSCNGALAGEVDCDAIGRICVQEGGESGPARCARQGDACSPYDPGLNVCEGASVQLCLGGQRALVDCAALGLGCVPASEGVSAHCG